MITIIITLWTLNYWIWFMVMEKERRIIWGGAHVHYIYKPYFLKASGKCKVGMMGWTWWAGRRINCYIWAEKEKRSG